jgi:serine/threonine protein kinase
MGNDLMKQSPNALSAIGCGAALFLAVSTARAAPVGTLLAQVSDDSTWIIVLVGIGVAAAIGIAAVIMKGGGPGGKKTRVSVSEHQVDGYRLLNLMMTGQTSQVWEATEVTSGRHFAIKMLLPEHARSHAHYLFHEYEVGRQVTHPKVIKMLALRRDSQHPYVIMEFFPSTNLKLRLLHKDAFIREHFRDIVEQTAAGLAYMHQKGWVHRDVKPDNILAASSGEVRIIDFALAQRLGKRRRGLLGRMKRQGRAQGTRTYMSPEQIRAEVLDARADIYSLGVTLFELLAWRPPFRAASANDLLTKQLYEKPVSPATFSPDVTDEMADLVLRMLAKDPEERPRDMQDFTLQFRKVRIIFKPAKAPKAE